MARLTTPPPPSVPKGLESISPDEEKVALQIAKDFQIALHAYEMRVGVRTFNNGKTEETTTGLNNLDIAEIFRVITRADPTLTELIRKANDNRRAGYA